MTEPLPQNHEHCDNENSHNLWPEQQLIRRALVPSPHAPRNIQPHRTVSSSPRPGWGGAGREGSQSLTTDASWQLKTNYPVPLDFSKPSLVWSAAKRPWHCRGWATRLTSALRIQVHAHDSLPQLPIDQFLISYLHHNLMDTYLKYKFLCPT